MPQGDVRYEVVRDRVWCYCRGHGGGGVGGGSVVVKAWKGTSELNSGRAECFSGEV